MDQTRREQQQAQNYAKSRNIKQLAASNNNEDKSGSESLQSTSQVKQNLKSSLRGMKLEETWNEEKGDWEKEWVEDEDRKALINHQGLEDLWSLVEPMVSETAAGSNLTGKDVAVEGFQSMKAVIGSVLVKKDEYEIEDLEDATIIVHAINDACKNNLKKAEGGRLLKHHEESTQRRIFRAEGEKEKSGLSKYNPFG